MELRTHQIPEDWQIRPIRQIYRFTKKPHGLDIKKHNSEIPFLPMDLIPLGRVFVEDFILRPIAKLGSGTYIENGDLLVAKITPSFENGKQAIARLQSDFAYASTEVIPLREIEGTSDKFYLFYILLHPEIRSDLAGKMEGSTGRQRLSKQVLGDRLIPFPPLAEQKKIAHILSTVQRAIEQQERIIQATTELKKALMHKLFTEGLHGEPQKETEIGLVPEGWEVCELGDLADLFGGYAFKSEEAIGKSNTQLVRMGNLYQNKLDLSRKPVFYPDRYVNEYPRFVLKLGDLIISLTGTTGKEDYGFTVEIEPTNKTLLLNQRVGRVDLRSSKVSKDYLLYFLLSRRFLDYLYPTAKGMKQANLSTTAMKKLKILVPEKDEQGKLVQCFRGLDAKISCHEKRTDLLKDLFRTLLHQLMTAQIRVHDINFDDLDVSEAA